MSDTIKAEQISKSFKEQQILSNLYFELNTGDILGVFGRNGSGKSTLFKILFGSLKADEIFLFYNGKRILNRRNFNRYISLSSQELFLPYSLKLKAVTKMMLAKQQQEIIYKDKFLKPYLKHKIAAIPFGLRLYAQHKLILYNESKFCLLDEPFSGLSPILNNKLKEDIKAQAKHKGIAITDHNYQDLVSISNRNILLDNAKSYEINEVEDLKEHGYL